MMMTKFVLTVLVGLSVVAPSGDALAVWWLFEDKKTVPDFKNSPWTGRPDAQVCNMSSQGGGWLREAKRRGLSCGVGGTMQTAISDVLADRKNGFICSHATFAGQWEKNLFEPDVFSP